MKGKKIIGMSFLTAALVMVLLMCYQPMTVRADGNEVTITDNGDGTYTFTMPGGDVNVTGSFKKLLTNTDITVSTINDQLWTGSAIEPDVTIMDGTTDITNQCNVSFSNNTEAGTAIVTITAKEDSTEYAGTTSTTFKIWHDDNTGTHFYGYALTLSGNIGLKFYLELDDAVLNDNNAFMRFNLPNGISDVYVKDIKDTSHEEIEGKTYYIFRCEVNAMNMTYTVKAQMHVGTGENEKIGQEYAYSVKDYADYLVANSSGNAEYTAAVPVIKAMLNYGAYSQIYFDHNTDILANANPNTISESEKNVSGVSASTINKPYSGDTNVFTGVTFEGVDLVLRSETILRLYFKNTTGKDITVTATNGTVEKSGEDIVVSFANIKSFQLDNDFTVTLSDGNNTKEISYSPMTYCYNVLNREKDTVITDRLKDLVRSLYLYNQAANVYFNQ